MNSIRIECLSPERYPLVNKFYRQFGARGKAKSHDLVFVVRANNEVVAAAKLIQCDDDTYLLAGVFTAPAFRNQGHALSLITYIVNNYDYIVTFAYCNLMPFYHRIGFNAVASLPPQLSKLFEQYQKQGRNIVAMMYCHE